MTNSYVKTGNLIATAFVVLVAAYSILYMIKYGSSEGYLLLRIEFPITGSHYTPAAYNVLTLAGLYFIFYTKLGVRSLPMSMFLWGVEDLIAFAEHGIYKAAVTGVTPSTTLGVPVLLESIAIDGLMGMVGLMVLKPHFNLKFTLGKVISIVMVVIGSVYSIATQTVGYSGYSNIWLNFVSYVTILGLFLYLYQSVEIRTQTQGLALKSK